MALYAEKIIPPEDLEGWRKQIKGRLVTLNGSFDLLHAGHLQIIHEAKLQGDILLMALNSDSSIKKYKSPTRPIIPLEYRLEIVAALGDVDFVSWFEETDPIAFLTKVRPDVHVNGAEYGKECIEAEVVRALGGQIHIVNLKPGLSTTSIIEKIRCEH